MSTGTCQAAERIAADQASRHVGERKAVCGEVVSATYARSSRGRPTFLNLDEPYPDHIFTALIWGSDRSKFDEPPEVKYRDKAICVTGRIESYRGKPQIIVRSPNQIELEAPAR
jgi:micrococcal nuclease